MLIRMNSPHYVIENFRDIPSMQDMISVLKCFVKTNEILLFSTFETNVKDCFSLEDQNFIKERTLFTNNKWVLPWESPFEEIPTNLWIKPINNDEIDRIIRLNLFEILCVVLNLNNGFDEFSYILYIHEHEYDDHSVERLHIIEKRKGDFVQNVLPQIKGIIHELEYIEG